MWIQIYNLYYSEYLKIKIFNYRLYIEAAMRLIRRRSHVYHVFSEFLNLFVIAFHT